VTPARPPRGVLPVAQNLGVDFVLGHLDRPSTVRADEARDATGRPQPRDRTELPAPRACGDEIDQLARHLGRRTRIKRQLYLGPRFASGARQLQVPAGVTAAAPTAQGHTGLKESQVVGVEIDGIEVGRRASYNPNLPCQCVREIGKPKSLADVVLALFLLQGPHAGAGSGTSTGSGSEVPGVSGAGLSSGVGEGTSIGAGSPSKGGPCLEPGCPRSGVTPEIEVPGA